MNFTLLISIELLLFNLAFVFVHQPQFIFSALRLKPQDEKVVRNVFLGLGLISICILFCWSFYFGVSLIKYKHALINN